MGRNFAISAILVRFQLLFLVDKMLVPLPGSILPLEFWCMVQIQGPILFAKDAPIPHENSKRNDVDFTLVTKHRYRWILTIQQSFDSGTDKTLLEIEFPRFLTLLKIL